MAQQTIDSCVDVYWVSNASKLNDNFTELYDAVSNDVVASVTTTATPATGSVGVQFVFKDGSGATIDYPFSGIGYISDAANGLASKAVATSVAVLTNGRLSEIAEANHNVFQFTTTAAGLLGLTITAAAGSYYVIFVGPTGRLIASTVCTVN